MKLVKHEGPLPRSEKRTWHAMRKIVDELFGEFIDMGVKTARVEINYGVEYKNFRSAYNSLYTASINYPEYGVRVATRNGEIYFVRKTM